MIDVDTLKILFLSNNYFRKSPISKVYLNIPLKDTNKIKFGRECRLSKI